MRYRWALVVLALALRSFNYFGAAANLAHLLPHWLNIFGLWYSSLAAALFILAITAVYASGSRLLRLLDLVLVFTLCGLRYAVEYSGGGVFSTQSSFLNFILGVNLFFLAAACIAWLAAIDAQEACFARLMMLCSLTKVTAAFFSNQIGFLLLHQSLASPWFLSATVGELLFVLVALRTLLRPEVTGPRRSPSLLARSAMSSFIALADIVLGIRLLAYHRSLGIAAIVIAVLCYTGRMVYLQVHYLHTQNDLLSRNTHLEDLLDRDALTGIGNRRSLATAIDHQCAEAHRLGELVYLLLIDIDGFKQANDSLGHLYGDRCLLSIANALARELRPTQHHLARYGGDEFAVVLRSPDLQHALHIADYLRLAVTDLQLGAPGQPLSLSIGVARATLPSAAIGHLLETADRALYRAKNQGRNCVVFGTEAMQPPSADLVRQ
jgi:diguanylate cyclase (GGDEF)-like protein